MAQSKDEIFKRVQEVLVDALGVDEDEVKPEASLREDLGAESIDFLDISFRLEKAFTSQCEHANQKRPLGGVLRTRDGRRHGQCERATASEV